MKILLLNPSMGDYYQGSKVKAAITLSPPLNLAILAAGLIRAGHKVSVVDQEAEPDADVRQVLRKLKPDMVGITFRTPPLPPTSIILFVWGSCFTTNFGMVNVIKLGFWIDGKHIRVYIMDDSGCEISPYFSV